MRLKVEADMKIRYDKLNELELTAIHKGIEVLTAVFLKFEEVLEKKITIKNIFILKTMQMIHLSSKKIELLLIRTKQV